MNPVAEYRALTAQLAAVERELAAESRAAEEAFADGTRRLDDRLAAAHSALAARREDRARAAAELIRTEDVADRVWKDVRSYVGRRAARRLGEVPEPAIVADRTSPESLLTSAKNTMAQARRGEWRPNPVRYAGAAAIVVGALASASVYGIARLFLHLGTEQALLPKLGAQLAVFLSPFAGIPLIVWGLARFFGQRTGVGTIALTVLGGLTVSCALTFLIR